MQSPIERAVDTLKQRLAPEGLAYTDAEYAEIFHEVLRAIREPHPDMIAAAEAKADFFASEGTAESYAFTTWPKPADAWTTMIDLMLTREDWEWSEQ